MWFVIEIHTHICLRRWSPIAIAKTQSLIAPAITFQRPHVDGAQAINIGSYLIFGSFGLTGFVIGIHSNVYCFHVALQPSLNLSQWLLQPWLKSTNRWRPIRKHRLKLIFLILWFDRNFHSCPKKNIGLRLWSLPAISKFLSIIAPPFSIPTTRWRWRCQYRHKLRFSIPWVDSNCIWHSYKHLISSMELSNNPWNLNRHCSNHDFSIPTTRWRPNIKSNVYLNLWIEWDLSFTSIQMIGCVDGALSQLLKFKP